MSVLVVVYGEGGRDVGGERPPRSPRERLGDEDLGPAHVLARRAISRVRKIPEAAVLFEAGLRLRGHVPRGAQLLERTNLRQLCTWPPLKHDGNPVARTPALAIVLVDEDGVTSRRAELQSHVDGLQTRVVIAVAVREFESWLVADGQAASQACGKSVSLDGEIERLERRAAKDRLQNWIADQNALSDRAARRSIAELADLDVVAKRCPSFATFLKDLAPTG